MENKGDTSHRLENSLENPPQEEGVEKFLKEQIFPDLEKGRPEFDKPHTQAVVTKLKDILYNVPNLQVDRAVLIIVAYAHDWGYSELFEGGKPVQLKEMADAKIAHMDFGAQKLEELLKDDFFNYLTGTQKERAVYLVRVHDRDEVWPGADDDVRIFVEADTLGVLDVNLVKPTFNRKSNQIWIDKTVKPKRMQAFLTDYSKKEAERLIEKREEYYRLKNAK